MKGGGGAGLERAVSVSLLPQVKEEEEEEELYGVGE